MSVSDKAAMWDQVRQYYPDGTDLSTYTQANLNTVARRLESRARG
jgi:IS30 family transposase